MAVNNVGSAVAPDLSAAQGKYTSDYGVRPEYQVMLNVRGNNEYLTDGTKVFPIVAACPERFNIEMSSEWAAPLAGASVGGVADAVAGTFGKSAGGSLIDLVQQVTGNATRNKMSSFQVWQSSSPISFSLELQFSADTNAENDVRRKHAALLKLVAPYESDTKMLLPPGPTLLGGNTISTSDKESRIVTLSIGKYIRLENAIVRSVSSDVSMILSKDTQLPMFMTIGLTIASFYESFTVQDISNMFGY